MSQSIPYNNGGFGNVYIFKLKSLKGDSIKMAFREIKKSIIDFLGSQFISVAKINFGIHFQFLSLQNECAFSWKQEL